MTKKLEQLLESSSARLQQHAAKTLATPAAKRAIHRDQRSEAKAATPKTPRGDGEAPR